MYNKFKDISEDYVAAYTRTPRVDGDIKDPVRKRMLWTNVFQDMERPFKLKSYYNTKVKTIGGVQLIEVRRCLRFIFYCTF